MKSKSPLVIVLKAHAAGNNLPTYSSAFGNISIGNIIPDNMMDGRKTICEIMVSFDIFFITSPKTHPILSVVAINTARDTK